MSLMPREISQKEYDRQVRRAEQDAAAIRQYHADMLTIKRLAKVYPVEVARELAKPKKK